MSKECSLVAVAMSSYSSRPAVYASGSKATPTLVRNPWLIICVLHQNEIFSLCAIHIHRDRHRSRRSGGKHQPASFVLRQAQKIGLIIYLKLHISLQIKFFDLAAKGAVLAPFADR